MTQQRRTVWLVLGLVVLGAGLRVLRHYGWWAVPPNVAPVSAIAMIAAAYLPRRWGWVAPLGLMIASDLAIGGYDVRIMGTVYASFGASFGLGLWLRSRRSVGRIALASLIGSVLFFLVTNAGVWAWGGLYQLTWAGLGQAYVAGLPFFRNTLIGDAVYSAVFFGMIEAVMVYWRQTHPERVTIHG